MWLKAPVQVQVKRKGAPDTGYHLMGRAPKHSSELSLSQHTHTHTHARTHTRTHTHNDGSTEGFPRQQTTHTPINTREAGHTGERERWSVSHKSRTNVCVIERKVTFTGQVCLFSQVIYSIPHKQAWLKLQMQNILLTLRLKMWLKLHHD